MSPEVAAPCGFGQRCATNGATPWQAGARHSTGYFLRGIRPFYMTGGAFEGEAMSRYFFEATA